MTDKNEINFFGLTSFRNQRKRFGIKTDDRRRHFYCIGKTGMGKSNLMENMAIQDIQAGRGIAYVDPHGEGAEKLLNFIPSNRINDVVFFNPADLDYPIAFNVMEKVDFRYRHLVAGGLMGVFKKVWPDVWSARMEYILNNTILALLEYPESTLLGVNRMLADVEYREKVVAKVSDPIVKSFWVTEYARYTQRYEIEATAAIQNKVGQFISNPLIRNLIGQVKSTIDMRDIMDKEKIFIMDLSKGRIGEDNSRLLGALLITKLQLAAMSRVDILEENRKDFYLYVDEFQNFATESFANILSEARKYRLNIILGHQYITQMEEEIRDAVFGNVGTLAVFRVGAEDAEFLEREFTPTFTAEDLVNLPKYNIYLKLMIDGVSGHPFSAETLPPPMPLDISNREKIINVSREMYGVKKNIVEEKISRWSGFGNDKEVGDHNNYNNQQKDVIMQQQNTTVLYDTICSNCRRPIKVVFSPEKGRSVFCKSCLKKMKAEPKSLDNNNVSLNLQGRRTEELNKQTFFGSSQNKPKRKEINLSELKKALEESLSPQVCSKTIITGQNLNEAKSITEKEKELSNDKKDLPTGRQGKIEPGQVIKF
jgi:CxxC-x17-CxxC domain-containing protein